MRARYADDSSIFLVDWQWVNDTDPTRDSGEIAFASNHTDPEHTDGGQVGEVRQVFYPLAKTFLPGFLDGSHQCGTDQQWREGWPAGTPPLEIVAGVPVCCVEGMGAAFDFGFDFGFES